MEWILQGIKSFKFFFFTRRSFTRLPFKIEISNETSNTNNYLGLFVSLGVVVFICLICSVCFYKCSKIIIENSNRRLEQRRRLNINNPHLILIPNEEDNLRKINQETLNKLLENDLKPMKYNEQINHFHTNCTICLEEFNSSMEVIFLFCKHIFHFKCLKDWLDKNILMPKCPNCNYNVLTGGDIDNNPNPNNENYNNNYNQNVELNFNNNHVINIHRNPNNSNPINNSIENTGGENNLIDIIGRNNELNQRQIDNPNYIENEAAAIEMDCIVNLNLSSRNNENKDKVNQNHAYNKIEFDYNKSKDSNKNEKMELDYDSNNKENKIQLSSQEIDLNENEDSEVDKNDIDKTNSKNADDFKKGKINLISENNIEDYLKRPPPNKPSRQTQNKQHNNFLIKENQKSKKNDQILNVSKNSIFNNSNVKILTEEFKEK